MAASRRTKKGTKRALKIVKGHFFGKMVVADTNVNLFKDIFRHFQIKIKVLKKITRQGSV